MSKGPEQGDGQSTGQMSIGEGRAAASLQVKGHGAYSRFHLNPNTKRTYVSLMALSMMNVAVMAGIGNDVQMSFYGFSSVTFYVVGALLFFLPTALVAAELATGWPENGGIFRWVSEGVGVGWGFFCITVLWIQQALVMGEGPASGAATMLFFTSNYDKAVKVAQDPVAFYGRWGMLAIMIGWLAFYWLLAWVSTKGVKTFSKLASWGVTLGTILPLALMIVLIVVWLAEGHHSAITMHASDLMPKWSGMSTLALAASVFFSYAGIDMNAAYVRQMKKPERDYPRAIAVTVFACLAIFIFGTLVIAMIVPSNQIDIVYTLNTVFKELGATIGMPWLYMVIVYLNLGNLMAQEVTSFAGPSLMFGQAGGTGLLPKWLQKKNKHGMPSHLVFTQCVFITIFAFIVELLPNVEGFIVLLSQAMTVLYLLYYILMFVTFLRLKYLQPNRPRTFTVPGGKVGAWVTAGVGIISAAFGIVMSIWPPEQVAAEVGSKQTYVLTILSLCAIIVLIPFVMYTISKRRNWTDPNNEFAPLTWQIEGLGKPSHSDSNVPTEVLAYDQNPMNMPIKHPFSPNDDVADLPAELLDDAHQSAMNIGEE